LRSGVNRDVESRDEDRVGLLLESLLEFFSGLLSIVDLGNQVCDITSLHNFRQSIQRIGGGREEGRVCVSIERQQKQDIRKHTPTHLAIVDSVMISQQLELDSRLGNALAHGGGTLRQRFEIVVLVGRRVVLD